MSIGITITAKKIAEENRKLLFNFVMFWEKSLFYSCIVDCTMVVTKFDYLLNLYLSKLIVKCIYL